METQTESRQILKKGKEHPARVLLTSSVYPYPTLPNDNSLTDATGARFTRADGIFTIVSHSHHFANHVLAQNIDVPSVILEYPRWEDYTREVKNNYEYIGISALPVHLDNVIKMCKYTREHAPQTKIILGCYAGMALKASMEEEEWKKLVDLICHGEGVQFMREILGEDKNRPIEQRLMPKGGGSPQFITKFPKGAMGFLVSGLGCPGRCDFCSSTKLYDHQRIEMLTPEKLVDSMYLYNKKFPNLTNIFVIEEDHFRWPNYVAGIKEHWEKHPDMIESFDWFAFGSMDNIGAFVEKYSWDAIAESGIGVMFIGVESKFGELLHYKKRSETDSKWIFKELHKRGIRTVGSWVCGWDFHTQNNIVEDLNYFVALEPTYQQLTRLSPFPGTDLWLRMKKEGRLQEVPWEDVHFWSGTQKNLSLEDHETLNMVEHGYELLYKTWGPSMLRRLKVQLQGYEYCLQSENKMMRDHKSIFYKKQCGMIWTLLPAMEKYAPNGIVRRMARQTDKAYKAVIGNPTPIMQTLSKAILTQAGKHYHSLMMDPSFQKPKTEPFKKYIYEKNGQSNDDIPYRTEWPTPPSREVKREMRKESVRYAALELGMKFTHLSRKKDSDPVIDNYLMGMVKDRAFGFGL